MMIMASHLTIQKKKLNLKAQVNVSASGLYVDIE